ncbi:hypothetical protein T4B_13004, partial [Trichinella pseudospiralis]
MTDIHHHYFSKWTITFCSSSENVSPNDGMLSIFVYKVKTAGYSYSVIRQHDDVIRKHWQL